jgi:CRP-like cAMP-binding protein
MRVVEDTTVGEVIAEHGRLRSWAPGVLLFVEGDHSDAVHVCVRGRVRLFLTARSGRELLIGMKSPGEEFGELSALDGRPRSASAVAVGPAVVAELAADRFVELLAGQPGLWASVCRTLSAELRLANDRLVARDSESALVRTGRMLVELASMRMRHHGADSTYELEITQSDLAGWIGATRESTARALARLRRAGLVRTGRGCIVVLDVVALSEAVAAEPIGARDGA